MIFIELFFTFFKIGLFTVGGGYAMLPLIRTEVLSKGWLTAEEIVNFIAVSESTPGPFAVNIATYIGSVRGGAAGAACATLGVVLPSFLIILVIERCYKKFKSSKIVAGLMSGLKPAVIGLIAAAVLTVGKTVFLNSSTPTGFPDRIGLVSNREFRIGFCACTLCLPKKTSSDINDFDCRCSRHSIRPFGRNACCAALTAALTPKTISPVRATHRIDFFRCLLCKLCIARVGAIVQIKHV